MKRRVARSASRLDWPDAARRLARSLPLDCLHPSVRRWVQQAVGPWSVALSGGADSLALLLLLWAHWPERRRGLLALHFNHGLRGRASDADARFCAAVCAGLGVRLRMARWERKARIPSSETAARAARMAFFDAVMTLSRRRVLWFGHHRNDVAESILMRLARGSGLEGLAAPRPVHLLTGGRVHVRPLLNLAKATLVAALDAQRIPWREDASNAEVDHLRNRLRQDVLPRWLAAEPQRDVLAGVGRSRDQLEEDAEALESWAAGVTVDLDRGVSIATLQALPLAVARRVVHRWRLRLGGRWGEVSRQTFEAVLVAARAGRSTRVSLGASGFARIERGRLRFEPVGEKAAKLRKAARAN
ncbi:MAG: tRNA lysidine(34) synthetase TilS [Verrucomicrobia bacterium]|nr:tRNA lysidine(34) synthetase TilS [Verrucomicrobiota bacterium]